MIHLGRVEEANLDASKPLKILCHGFLDGITSAWYASAISEYFESQDVNIIAIDWPATNLYSNTVATAKIVAEVNAELLVELVNKLNVDLSNVHLIGHSLGAHISGLTGKHGCLEGWKLDYIFVFGQGKRFWLQLDNKLVVLLVWIQLVLVSMERVPMKGCRKMMLRMLKLSTLMGICLVMGNAWRMLIIFLMEELVHNQDVLHVSYTPVVNAKYVHLEK